MDFVCEFLNFLFWAQFDFTALGVDAQERDSTVAHIREAWEFNRIEVPLPTSRTF